MSEENQQFAIQKIYLKDVSFESPHVPMMFTQENLQPQVNVQIQTGTRELGENTYEVNLNITVTATHEDKTAFLVEVKQAGVFTMSGFSEENLKGMLGAFCPETLFPFAREAIADLVSKGGFPPVLLAPVNFNALYMQQQQQKQAGAGEAQPEASH